MANNFLFFVAVGFRCLCEFNFGFFGIDDIGSEPLGDDFVLDELLVLVGFQSFFDFDIFTHLTVCEMTNIMNQTNSNNIGRPIYKPIRIVFYY